MIRARNGAVLFALATVLAAGGCYQGSGKTVSDQGPSGNGTDFTVGDGLQVQDLTVIADGEGSGSVLMTLINNGEQDDALMSISTDPTSTVTASAGTSSPTPTATPDSGATETASQTPEGTLVAAPVGEAVQVGGASATTITLTGLTTAPGHYLSMTLQFARNGSATEQVAVAPATGIYEGWGPGGSSAEPTQAPQGEPTGGEVTALPNATDETPSVATEPAESPSH